MRRAGLLLLAPFVAFACADSTTINPVRPTYKGTLAVDIRGTVDVTLSPSDQGTDVTLASWHEGYALFDPTKPLTAKGRTEIFAESPGWEVYTAKFATVPPNGGACGTQPVSIAMSLARRDGNARVQGSLTAYCGISYSGVPARVLRLTGDAGRELTGRAGVGRRLAWPGRSGLAEVAANGVGLAGVDEIARGGSALPKWLSRVDLRRVMNLGGATGSGLAR
jgi:hypothetical protein